MYSCLTPIRLGEDDVFPCGKCVRCRDKKVNEWAARLLVECASSYNVHYVTLTYATQFLPFASGEPSLSPFDLEKFFKRLRRLSERRFVDRDTKIRYVAAGEYGGKIGRPHYHAIIIGCKAEDIVDAWRDPDTKEHLGNVFFGHVCPETIKYVFKYILKSSTNELELDGLGSNVCPNFHRFSRGLGKCYLTPARIKWHKADLPNRMYLQWKGVKFPLPRYLKDKLYNEDEKRLIRAYFENLEIEPLEFEAIQIIQQFTLTSRTNQRSKIKKHESKKYAQLASN